MNISSSISQVIYETQLPGKILLKKAYVWPEYNAGKVHSIAPVREKHEPNFNYVKRSAHTPDQENIALKLQKDSGYNSRGSISSISANYTPGSIFEALA